MKKCKLIFFPYAGSSVMSYKKWDKYFSNDIIDMELVELSGRGKRFTEPFYQSMDELVDDVFSKIQNIIENEPYAFFGHSMGSDIACYIADKIIANNLPEPIHMFLSSRKPPSVSEKILYHTFNDDEFKDAIFRISDENKTFLENKELSKIFLPVLKNDFRIIETVVYNQPGKYNCDLSILYGDNEEINHEVQMWKNHTNKKCDLYCFEGDHFYLFHHENEITDLIKNKLKEGMQI